jgi:hypothetical protein
MAIAALPVFQSHPRNGFSIVVFISGQTNGDSDSRRNPGDETGKANGGLASDCEPSQKCRNPIFVEPLHPGPRSEPPRAFYFLKR